MHPASLCMKKIVHDNLTYDALFSVFRRFLVAIMVHYFLLFPRFFRFRVSFLVFSRFLVSGRNISFSGDLLAIIMQFFLYTFVTNLHNRRRGFSCLETCRGKVFAVATKMPSVASCYSAELHNKIR